MVRFFHNDKSIRLIGAIVPDCVLFVTIDKHFTITINELKIADILEVAGEDNIIVAFHNRHFHELNKNPKSNKKTISINSHCFAYIDDDAGISTVDYLGISEIGGEPIVSVLVNDGLRHGSWKIPLDKFARTNA